MIKIFVPLYIIEIQINNLIFLINLVEALLSLTQPRKQDA